MTYRVKIQIEQVVNIPDNEGPRYARDQVWYECWDEGGASNLPPCGNGRMVNVSVEPITEEEFAEEMAKS